MEQLKAIELPVKEALAKFNIDFAKSLHSNTALLNNAIHYIMNSTGKHVRPLLLLLSAKACGRISENSINSSVLLELLHTATLIHDDVVDETKQRRGVPSLNAIFDNRVSVLTGDYLLATALIRAIKTQNLQIISIVSNLGRQLSEGELHQMEVAEESVLDEEVYMSVIYKKTAALLSSCSQIGAISVEADTETVKICAAFGEALGYAFQIKDDIFDYDAHANIGKPTGNDIREGKVTLPLLYALQVGRGEERERLLQLVKDKDFTHEHVHQLIQYSIKMGGLHYAEKKMQFYMDKAIESILQLPPSDSRDSLVNLAHFIIDRKK